MTKRTKFELLGGSLLLGGLFVPPDAVHACWSCDHSRPDWDKCVQVTPGAQAQGCQENGDSCILTGPTTC